MYVAGFVIPVPEDKMEAYRKWAENGAAIFRAYGCIEIVESWEDNVPSGKYTDFRRAVDAKDGEKIVFSWQVWPDKATLDSAEAKNARGRGFGGHWGNSVRPEAPHSWLLQAGLHHGPQVRDVRFITPPASASAMRRAGSAARARTPKSRRGARPAAS